MKLLDLNDDVLLYIFSHLHGDHALNLALTCSKAFRLAVPRVAAVVQCYTHNQLRRLHAYLCGHDSRVRNVESLEITPSAFWPPGHADDDNFRTYIHADFFQAGLVADIILGADRLRRLSLARLHPLVHQDARILPAVLALRRLTDVTFDTVADGCITALQGASFCNLQTLSLRYHNDSVGFGLHIDGETMTYPPLLRLLSSFSRLRKLELQFFTPEHTASGCEALSAAAGTVPSFSSIHELQLYDITPSAFNLIVMCPALSSLDVGLTGGTHVTAYTAPSPRWPHLRRLRIEGRDEIICAANLLSTVHLLEIMDYISVDPPETFPGRVYPNQLLEVFRQTSPVSAKLWAEPCGRPMSFWPQVANVAPRLRVLELRVTEGRRSTSLVSWVADMPHHLSPLRIVYLSVRLPVVSLHYRSTLYPDQDHVRQVEASVAMVGATETLRRLIPQSLPTLYFFTLTGAREATEEEIKVQSRNESSIRRQGGTEEDSDEEQSGLDGDAVEELEQRQPMHLPGIRTSTWRWRVIHEGTERRLELLTARDAARVQRYIDETDFVGIERVHEFLP